MRCAPLPDLRAKHERLLIEGDAPSAMHPPPGCRFHTCFPVTFDRFRVEEPAFKPSRADGRLVCSIWVTDMGDILARLGLTRVVNAAGTLTRLGGAPMAPAVAAAMADAAGLSVDLWTLQAEASRRIAALTHAEAGIVTTGASAGLTLAAAAAIAGLDPARMERLPGGDMPCEIVMPRTHRNGYDRAYRMAGAVLVDVGVDDRGTRAGIRGLEAWEVQAAIGPRTAALAATASAGTLGDLPMIAGVARSAGLPLIVDAAAQLPPRANFHRFIDLGASLVVFSGGKAIGGPQASGILAGARGLIASAALQMLDMDLRLASFSAPAAFFPEGAPAALPRHGLGRGYKASKETIVGLLAALERFSAANLVAESAANAERLGQMAASLGGLRGLTCRLEPAAHAECAPRLALVLDPSEAGRDALGVIAALAAHAPPVVLGERGIDENILSIDLACVAPDDDALLLGAIRSALKV